MSELTENVLTENNKPLPAAQDEIKMDRAGVILLVLSFLAALLYCFAHSWTGSVCPGPGIGLAISHWLLTGVTLAAAKARGRLTLRRDGLFLLILSLLLSAVYAVFANTTLRRLNLPVLLLITAQALFALTGQNTASALSGQGLWEGFRRYLKSLFRCRSVPFTAVTRRTEHNGYLLPGILAAICTMTLAAILLSSADQVFSGMLDSVAEKIRDIDFLFIFRLFLALILTLILFSHRFSLLQAPGTIRPVTARAGNPTMFYMVLASLALVYALFGYVQIRYLFAGTESVRMSGGYAAYARSGFFQLVMVALLTLCLILPALSLFRENTGIRILCALTAVLTIIIDVSAYLRMHLYIEAFGLSTLRVVTVWGIGIILLALLAVIAKSIRPQWQICPLLAAVILASWVVLNWANVDRLVADSQVARYNRNPENTGIYSLVSDQGWSPEYYAAFEKIEDPVKRGEALEVLTDLGSLPGRDGQCLNRPALYDWSLAYLKAK
ncbi:MAG: DUF4173 domain-containing protein [Clostridia bacterium]|nr:DUF4173 domain-containing protein [Clostridia bacterium]